MTDGIRQLETVVYTSRAHDDWDDARLTGLLAASRERNARAGVTGMLLYRDGRFLQVIEGPSEEIDALMTRIEADPRHHGVRVMMRERIASRSFDAWTMGYRPWAAPADPLPPGFRDTFDDLDGAGDAGATLRAVRELSRWFRHRSRPAASGAPEAR